MSKNITIQEGGIAKQMTADKLKTNLVDGGTCLWIPEDEVKLGTLNVTGNGTYNASDEGYTGYSQVFVSYVSAPDGAITGYDQNGNPYVIEIEDGEINPIIEDGTELIRIVEDEQGNEKIETYTWDAIPGVPVPVNPESDYPWHDGDELVTDDGTKYVVSVDEEGNPTLEVPEDLTIKGTDESGKSWEVSTDGSGEIEPIDDSGLVGTDEDGNAVMITVDENTGEFIKTKLATDLVITTPPSRTTYPSGGLIDFSGIVVKAYANDGTLLGEVPYSELIFPVTRANLNKVDDIEYVGHGITSKLVDCYDHVTYRVYAYGRWKTYDAGYVDPSGIGTRNGNKVSISTGAPTAYLATIYNGRLYVAVMSSTSGSMGLSEYVNEETAIGWSLFASSGGPTADGKFHASFDSIEYMSKIPTSSSDPTGISKDALNKTGGTQIIPVRWLRYGDNASLITSFKIEVTPGYGGANEEE